jgi:hypothetical protein
MATAKRSRAMSAKVRKYLAKHPTAKAQAVADATGATAQYVHNIRYMDKKKGVATAPAVKKPEWKTVGAWTVSKSLKKRLASVQEGVAKLQAQEAMQDIIATHHTDMVNHPPHYKMGGIETIDFIEAKGFGYNLGNVVKYISRADHKGSHYEDLLKARWYLNREIAKFSPDTKVSE